MRLESRAQTRWRISSHLQEEIRQQRDGTRCRIQISSSDVRQIDLAPVLRQRDRERALRSVWLLHRRWGTISWYFSNWTWAVTRDIDLFGNLYISFKIVASIQDICCCNSNPIAKFSAKNYGILLLELQNDKSLFRYKFLFFFFFLKNRHKRSVPSIRAEYYRTTPTALDAVTSIAEQCRLEPTIRAEHCRSVPIEVE